MTKVARAIHVLKAACQAPAQSVRKIKVVLSGHLTSLLLALLNVLAAYGRPAG